MNEAETRAEHIDQALATATVSHSKSRIVSRNVIGRNLALVGRGTQIARTLPECSSQELGRV